MKVARVDIVGYNIPNNGPFGNICIQVRTQLELIVRLVRTSASLESLWAVCLWLTNSGTL